jgi:hypothetical membrane protein
MSPLHREERWDMTSSVRQALLFCGILASLLYVGADLLAAGQWPGYSYTDQAVSELMAVGAPTRPFLVSLFTVYNALMIAFGMGVWATGRRKRSLRVTGLLLIGYGILGEVGLLFFPMHLRGAVGTPSDFMHIIATLVMVLFIVLFIGFGASARGQGFRLYSLATILVLLLFGAWASLDGPRIAAGLPTPWLGVKERVNIYVSLLWVLVLAVSLLRAEQKPASTAANGG